MARAAVVVLVLVAASGGKGYYAVGWCIAWIFVRTPSALGNISDLQARHPSDAPDASR